MLSILMMYQGKTLEEWAVLLNNSNFNFEAQENFQFFDVVDEEEDIPTDEIQIFCDALRLNPSCRELNLSKNFLKDKDVILIMQALEINTNVKKISFSFNCMSPVGVVSILQAMKTNTTLEFLDLSFNFLDDPAIDAALKGMLQNNKTLWHLDCSRACKSEHISDRMNFTGISDETLIAIAHGIKDNSSLRSLKLSGNELSKSQLSLLAGILRENTTLECLDLSENGIISEFDENNQTQDEQSFLLAIESNRTLRKLDLTNNLADESDQQAENDKFQRVLYFQRIAQCLERNQASRYKREWIAIYNAIILLQGYKKNESLLHQLPEPIFKHILFLMLAGLRSNSFLLNTIDLLYQNVITNRGLGRFNWWEKDFKNKRVFSSWSERNFSLLRKSCPEEQIDENAVSSSSTSQGIKRPLGP